MPRDGALRAKPFRGRRKYPHGPDVMCLPEYGWKFAISNGNERNSHCEGEENDRPASTLSRMYFSN